MPEVIKESDHQSELIPEHEQSALLHKVQQSISELLRRDVSTRLYLELREQYTNLREGKIRKDFFTQWLSTQLGQKLERQIQETTDDKSKHSLQQFLEQLKTATELALSKRIGSVDFLTKAVDQNLIKLKELPDYLDQIGVYNDFYNLRAAEALEKIEKTEQAQRSPQETPPAPSGLLEQTPENRQPVEGQPIFEKLDQGLSSRSDQDTERQVTFSEPGEPFYVGRIETAQPEIYGQLFITGIWDLASPDGSVKRVEQSYRPVETPILSALPARTPDQTDVTIPINVKAPSQVIDLPLPLGYEIVGIDARVSLEESELGTYRLRNLPNLPTEAIEIHYRIAPRSKQLTVTEENRTGWTQSWQTEHVHPTTRLADQLAAKQPETAISPHRRWHPFARTDLFISASHRPDIFSRWARSLSRL